jgi:hypothetical protein
MEKRKPAKSPCPICAKPLAPQGVALHYATKHPSEAPPRPPAPASAEERTESAPPSAAPASSSAPEKRSGGVLRGPGGILS